MNTYTINLKCDLDKIKNCVIQCKMNFNRDPGKHVQEVIFSRKLQKTNHNQVYFNRNFVQQVPSQKNLRKNLDTKLNFQEHLNNGLSKVNKTIGLLRKLQAFLPRQSVVTVYKAFIRSHLNYGDIFYDRTYNDSFYQKIESIQYNTALAITGATRGGTSREKCYQELGLESLHKRGWYKTLCYFFKIFKGRCPEYLFRILSSVNKIYDARTNSNISLFNGKHMLFRNCFFSSTVIA